LHGRKGDLADVVLQCEAKDAAHRVEGDQPARQEDGSCDNSTSGVRTDPAVLSMSIVTGSCTNVHACCTS
jgi:hypothetical protein